jgi:CheY-like chemotaxis protein
MTDPFGSPLVSTNRRRPLRILLADGQAPNRLVVHRLLRSLSYSIDIVVNVREAPEHQEYDVVLMDVLMPEMDGLEATRQIRRNRPEEQRPNVIALTADATSEDREMCRAVSMDDFVVKPPRTSDLIRVLERYHAQTDQDETPGAMIGVGHG